MSYQVIARKYRPQVFDEVVGQRLVCETLKNAILSNRVAHSYIFSGARGVGKTTMARIVAKALNCAKGPTVNPCGECASCQEIAAGNSVDVLEIDAASNRGIDEIRQLRESVRYLPARDPTKVFIIDEVHMLTTEAFNALLKTLEEPPARALFILATTEPHKLPATIQSRCQHFAFRLLDYAEIVGRLKEICGREGVDASEAALGTIAQAAEGSLRDALSLLDEVIAACGAKLDDEKVRQLLGVASSKVLAEMAEATHAGLSRRVLELVHDVTEQGHDLSAFCAEFTRFIRNLMIARSCGAESPLLQIPSSDRPGLARLAALFTEEDLTRFFQILLRAQSEMRYSLQPRFHLELALLKLAHAPKLAALESLLSTIQRLEVAPARGGPAPPEGTARNSSPAGARLPESKPIRASTPPTAPRIPPPRDASPDSSPAEPVVAEDPRLSSIKAVLFEQSKFLSSCLNPVRGWRFEDGQVHLIYSSDGAWAADLLKSREHQEKVRAACEKALGERVGKIYVTLSTEVKREASPEASARERAERDPSVEAFQRKFDCILTDVKDLSRE